MAPVRLARECLDRHLRSWALQPSVGSYLGTRLQSWVLQLQIGCALTLLVHRDALEVSPTHRRVSVEAEAHHHPHLVCVARTRGGRVFRTCTCGSLALQKQSACVMRIHSEQAERSLSSLECRGFWAKET